MAVRRTYVSPEIHRRVMDSLAEDGFRSLIELAWETGARPQELRLIEPRHCDLVRGRIVFQASEAKGKKRDRVIWLSETAALIVSMLIASRTGDGPLLRTNDGTAWSAWAISNRFRRLKRVLGLPSLCLYEYRHGFAVRKLDDSIESLTVAQLMGHVDTKMLSRVYGHLDQNERLMKAALGHAKEARHDVEISSPP